MTTAFGRHINVDLAKLYLARGIQRERRFVVEELLDPLIFEERIDWLEPYLLKAQVQFDEGHYDTLCNDTLNVAAGLASSTGDAELITAVSEARQQACDLAASASSASAPGNTGQPQGNLPATPPGGRPADGNRPPPPGAGGGPPPPGAGG